MYINLNCKKCEYESAIGCGGVPFGVCRQNLHLAIGFLAELHYMKLAVFERVPIKPLIVSEGCHKNNKGLMMSSKAQRGYDSLL